MNRNILIAIVLLALGGSLFARWMFFTPARDLVVHAPPAGGYSRVVSMAPSITETLFALDLADKVAGVTRYCDFPPEAKAKPQVGGLLDPNYEAIVALEPDLAILLTIHDEADARLKNLGIHTLVVEHRTLEGILTSFRLIGEACGGIEAAEALVIECERRMERVRSNTAGLERPRVLISSARELGSGRLGTVYAAGKGQWYDNLIEVAGGTNVFEDSFAQFPAVSAEGLLRLDPDVVIEMAPDLADASYTREDILAEWATLPGMTAVKTGRVYVLGGDYVPVPGPRFVQTLEDMAKVLHPGVDWSAP